MSRTGATHKGRDRAAQRQGCKQLSCFHISSWSCRRLPAAAERFYERDGGDELLASQRGGSKFDVESGAFGRGDFEIGDEAVTVLIINNFELFPGGDQGLAFRGVL